MLKKTRWSCTLNISIFYHALEGKWNIHLAWCILISYISNCLPDFSNNLINLLNSYLNNKVLNNNNHSRLKRIKNSYFWNFFIDKERFYHMAKCRIDLTVTLCIRSVLLYHMNSSYRIDFNIVAQDFPFEVPLIQDF